MAADAPLGLLVVDKPPGPTSHDVVAQVRRAFSERRCGHGGTLDPPASGVLLVALGRATRLLRYVADLDKCYEGEVVFGTATSTLDDSGEVTATVAMPELRPAAVAAAAARFVGPIEQVPPMVSAVKVGGRRLYELARAGQDVVRPARPVTIHALEVAPTGDPLVYRLLVSCSSGTYVRSLAADLGASLGGAAHLRSLRRTAIGPFSVSEARPLDGLAAAPLRPPLELVAHLARAEVAPEAAAMVAHGAVLEQRLLKVSPPGPWALVAGGELLAVYEARPGDLAKPAVVLATAGHDRSDLSR